MIFLPTLRHIKLMSEDLTCWPQLSAEIDQYRKRAKKAFNKYENRLFNSLYMKPKRKPVQDHCPETDSEGEPFPYTLHLIRSRQQEEKQSTSSMMNKVGYLRVQRDRKLQSMERVKNKLSRVLSIRSINSQDKNKCQQEIKLYESVSLARKKDMADRVKSERVKIEEQRKKILHDNSYRAQQTKQQRVEHESAIRKEKHADLLKRQKMVEKGQIDYEEAIQKNKERQAIIQEQGRINHNNYKQDELAKYQSMKKMNRKLQARIDKESEVITQQTTEAEEKLRKFERELRLRKEVSKNSRPQNIKNSSTFIKNGTPMTALTSKSSTQSVKKKINNFTHFG